MNFVLDNSVSMRWIQPSEKKKDQEYANSVLDSLIDNEAITSDVWRIETVNAVLNLVKHKTITQKESELFLNVLDDTNIHSNGETANMAFSNTFLLAQKHNLASYDATYLELAIRENLPLATLDKKLIKAAKKEDVQLWLH